MNQVLTLAEPRQARDRIGTSRIESRETSRTEAAAACAAFFARVEPAGLLDADDRRAMIDAVVTIVSVDRDRAVTSSSRSAQLLLIAEGWAYRAYTLPDGTRQITDIFLPGDVCWSVPGMPFETGYEVRACGPVRVVTLRQGEIFGRQACRLRHGLEWALSAEAAILRSRLISVGRRDARGRIVALVMELYQRLQNVGFAEDGHFSCPLTQEQLGDVLGLTSIHVNRVLQRLRRDSLVMFDRPRLFIPDLSRLLAAAACDTLQ